MVLQRELPPVPLNRFVVRIATHTHFCSFGLFDFLPSAYSGPVRGQDPFPIPLLGVMDTPRDPHLGDMGIPGGCSADQAAKREFCLSQAPAQRPSLPSYRHTEKDAPFYWDLPGKSLLASYGRQLPSAKGQGAALEQGS